MTITSSSVKPVIVTRSRSPGEPPTDIVVDEQSKEELVIVSPRFGTVSFGKRRYHVPDLSTVELRNPHSAVQPSCSVSSKTGGEWGYRKRRIADHQAECCQYCSGETSRAENSKKSGEARRSGLTATLNAMSVEEFETATDTHSSRGSGGSD